MWPAVTWGETTVARLCAYQLRVLDKRCACGAGIRPCTQGVAPVIYCLRANIPNNWPKISGRTRAGCRSIRLVAFRRGVGFNLHRNGPAAPGLWYAAAAGSAQRYSCMYPNPSLVCAHSCYAGFKGANGTPFAGETIWPRMWWYTLRVCYWSLHTYIHTYR